MVFVSPTHPSVTGPPCDPGTVLSVEDARTCPREFYILSIADKRCYYEVEGGRAPNKPQKEFKGGERTWLGFGEGTLEPASKQGWILTYGGSKGARVKYAGKYWSRGALGNHESRRVYDSGPSVSTGRPAAGGTQGGRGRSCGDWPRS